MRSSVTKPLLWVLLAAGLFALFRWLFGLAVPGAALSFAVGTTVIVLTGLLTGTYAARLWHKAEAKTVNRTLAALMAGTIGCLLLMGFLVQQMIGDTQFHHFLSTVIALFLANVFGAMLISLVRHRIRQNLRSVQTALAQSKTELQLIQAQLSPHFLFNTLNNLYGLSLTEHQKVPPLLLRLSELLRYSVYEAKEVFVPLRDEVNYMKNYIEFEKIRLGDRLSLTLNIQEEVDASLTLAPMLLIVFVENAFKHARNNADEQIFIDIALRTEADAVFFSVKNSCAPQGTVPPAEKVHGGFGLDSVKKRLELLYPKRHALTLIQAERSYSATLNCQCR